MAESQKAAINRLVAEGKISQPYLKPESAASTVKGLRDAGVLEPAPEPDAELEPKRGPGKLSRGAGGLARLQEKGDIIPLIILGIGGYIVWYAIHYWRSEAVSWPTDPIKSILTGKGLPAPSKPASHLSELQGTQTAADASTAAVITATPTGSGGTAAPTAAGKYSYTQLEQLWTGHGGDSSKAAIAAAVAMAESAGDPNASNKNSDGSVDRGLWQINSVHGSQSTFDPVANVQAAIMISSNGTNWGPWVTFNSGAYKKFLQ